MPNELQKRAAARLDAPTVAFAEERWAGVRTAVESRHPGRPSLVDKARMAMLVALDQGFDVARAEDFARFAVGLPRAAEIPREAPGSSIWRLAP